MTVTAAAFQVFQVRPLRLIVAFISCAELSFLQGGCYLYVVSSTKFKCRFLFALVLFSMALSPEQQSAAGAEDNTQQRWTPGGLHLSSGSLLQSTYTGLQLPSGPGVSSCLTNPNGGMQLQSQLPQVPAANYRPGDLDDMDFGPFGNLFDLDALQPDAASAGAGVCLSLMHLLH